MTDPKLSGKFQLRFFALHIGNLSKAADDVADQLPAMAIITTMQACAGGVSHILSDGVCPLFRLQTH